MAKHKKAKKHAKKALKKAKKHGPLAAALAVIVGELAAAVKRAHLDRLISDVAVDAIDRYREHRHARADSNEDDAPALAGA